MGVVERVAERRIIEAREQLFERVCESLRLRLLPVCDQMDVKAFDDLVRRAAQIQIKYETRRQVDLIG